MPEQNPTKQAVIVKIGAHQHLLFGGNKITTARVDKKEGESITAQDLLTGQDVTLKVVAHNLADKINGLKFKNKVRYLKRYGHRQEQSVLELVSKEIEKPVTKNVPTKVAKPSAKKAKVLDKKVIAKNVKK